MQPSSERCPDLNPVILERRPTFFSRRWRLLILAGGLLWPEVQLGIVLVLWCRHLLAPACGPLQPRAVIPDEILYALHNVVVPSRVAHPLERSFLTNWNCRPVPAAKAAEALD